MEEILEIKQIKQLMHKSCDDSISVEHLCQQAGFSYNTLRKLFRRVEGISLIKKYNQFA